MRPGTSIQTNKWSLPQRGLEMLLLALLLALSGGCKRTALGDVTPAATRLPETGEQVCLSLKVLAREVSAGLNAGRPLRQELETLAGIGWLEGFVVDRAGGDVILIGRRCPAWPSLHLDDLVVNLRSIWTSNAYPYCSLDPRPQDVVRINDLLSQSAGSMTTEQMEELFAQLQRLWGPQVIVVGGVPHASRLAHVMIDSDYDMKKVCHGLAELPGITSCLDMQLNEAKDAVQSGRDCATGMSMSRFWFHVARGEPTFKEADGIVHLNKCSVVVLTEAQKAAADGTLCDGGAEDQHAQAFAKQFSQSFAEVAEHKAVYADLENLYRLNSLLRAMQFRRAAQDAGLDLTFFLERYPYQRESPMPATMPGLTNHRKEQTTYTTDSYIYTHVFFPMVCGGVSMEIDVRARSFCTTEVRELASMRSAILKARPQGDSLYWRLTAS